MGTVIVHSVVSHRPKSEGWHPGASCHFADGVTAAIDRAQELAGQRTVAVNAGEVGSQIFAAGLVGEVAIERHGLAGTRALERAGVARRSAAAAVMAWLPIRRRGARPPSSGKATGLAPRWSASTLEGRPGPGAATRAEPVSWLEFCVTR